MTRCNLIELNNKKLIAFITSDYYLLYNLDMTEYGIIDINTYESMNKNIIKDIYVPDSMNTIELIDLMGQIEDDFEYDDVKSVMRWVNMILPDYKEKFISRELNILINTIFIIGLIEQENIFHTFKHTTYEDLSNELDVDIYEMFCKELDHFDWVDESTDKERIFNTVINGEVGGVVNIEDMLISYSGIIAAGIK